MIVPILKKPTLDTQIYLSMTNNLKSSVDTLLGCREEVATKPIDPLALFHICLSASPQLVRDISQLPKVWRTH